MGIELTGYEDSTDPFGLECGQGDICTEDFVRLLGVTEFEVRYIEVQIFRSDIIAGPSGFG